MSSDLCPVWAGRFLASPFRRRLHDPETLLGPYVRPGMWVLDAGCGMGYFTIPMARMLDGRGRVVAVDRQEGMILALAARLQEERLYAVVEPRICPEHTLRVGDLPETFDFALLFAVAHEAGNQCHLFAELFAAVRPGGHLLVAEPAHHVTGGAFEASVERACGAGFTECGRPGVPGCHAALFGKP